jgi:hypothetical protein
LTTWLWQLPSSGESRANLHFAIRRRKFTKRGGEARAAKGVSLTAPQICKKPGSQWTQHWSKPDSNSRSHLAVLGAVSRVERGRSMLGCKHPATIWWPVISSGPTRVPARMVAQQVKGLTILVNSIYNGARYEDVWLDK